MRMNVGSVRGVCAAALAAMVLAVALMLILQAEGVSSMVDWNGPTACLVGYAATLLAFASLPRVRRFDLAHIVVAGGAGVSVLTSLWTGALDLLPALTTALGAYAALTPSFVERFRTLIRDDPYEPFSMVYPNERRRRGARQASAGRATERLADAGLQPRP